MLSVVSPHILLAADPRFLPQALEHLKTQSDNSDPKLCMETAILRNCGPRAHRIPLSVFDRVVTVEQKIACHLVDNLTVAEIRQSASLIVKNDVIKKFHLIQGYIDKQVVDDRVAELRRWPNYWVLVETAYMELLASFTEGDLTIAYLCGFPLENGFPSSEWLREHRRLRATDKNQLIEKLKTETELWLAQWPGLLNDEDLSHHAPLSSLRIIDLYCYTDGTKSHVFSRDDVGILLERKTNPWTTLAIPESVLRVFSARFALAATLPQISLIEEL